MRRYIIRCTFQTVVVLFIVLTLCFFLMHFMPGGPFTARPKTLSDRLIMIAMDHEYGLDKPLIMQYFDWLAGLTHASLGMDFNGMPLTEVISPYVWNTLLLTVTSFVVSLVIAIPWGMYNSLRTYGFSDVLANTLAYVGFALPSFALAIELQQLFSMNLLWLPPTGMYSTGHQGQIGDLVPHMILPVTVLAFAFMVNYVKYTRTSFLEVLPLEYVRTARAKGASEVRVMFRHVLRNVMIPITTVLALDLKNILSGAAIVEIVFHWPGVGALLVHSAESREYPRMLAILMVSSVIVTIGSWVADMVYMLVDPRVRLARQNQTAAR